MSENSLRFAALQPDAHPSSEALERAAATVRSAFPRASAIEVREWDAIAFIDNGANLEAVRCPDCGTDLLDDGTWSDLMARAYDTRFEERTFELPCCGATHALEALVYDWPVAFGRFSIDVLEPDSPAFTPGASETPFEAELLAALGAALGTPAKAVWQHL